MKILTIALALTALTLGAAPAECATAAKKYTFAVFGDWPYSQALLQSSPLLIASVNADPDVALVIHVGDIHSGSMPCTGAGLNPIPASAVPNWNRDIFNLFEQFEDPMIYTPGDNEWTDCHKKKESYSGAPLNELAAVRSLFFARVGQTLGVHKTSVLSQAIAPAGSHSEDRQFVENVMWRHGQVVFATLNVPGSNNDGIAWSAPFTDELARKAEVAARTAADLRWIDLTFDKAIRSKARGVVISLQADMWDPEALGAGGDGLSGYTTIVQKLARRALDFGGPVLLINGDSHKYEADQPLADPNSATGVIHNTPPVRNLTRLTVQGSTDTKEWLKVSIQPRGTNVFTWKRIQYLP